MIITAAIALLSPALLTKPLQDPLMDSFRIQKSVQRHYFVFLNRGARRDEIVRLIPKKELDTFQGKHLANFTRLWHEKKLVIVGPMGDSGPLRGIVLLKADSREGLLRHFELDPLVSKGLLDPEVYEMTANFLNIDNSNEKAALIQNTLVIVSKGPNWTSPKPALPRHTLLAGEEEWTKAGKLAFVASFDRKTDKIGVLYFYSKDAAAVLSEANNDPLVKGGFVTTVAHPQWMPDWFKKPTGTSGE
jgi:uncharacterized protein YciI